jgi:hypothetical protein
LKRVVTKSSSIARISIESTGYTVPIPGSLSKYIPGKAGSWDMSFPMVVLYLIGDVNELLLEIHPIPCQPQRLGKTQPCKTTETNRREDAPIFRVVLKEQTELEDLFEPERVPVFIHFTCARFRSNKPLSKTRWHTVRSVYQALHHGSQPIC